MPTSRRLQGIYPQVPKGLHMLRVKVPGGLLSATQARALCDISDTFSRGVLHLTTRMSVELHDVSDAALDPVLAALAKAGLTSRGACGGAVRGVAVSTPFGAEAPRARHLARTIHNHFTNDPAYEDLPKKFKIGVDTDTGSGRHRIQDAGLVLAEDGAWDVWLAGGLGRPPRAGFLFQRRVPEAQLLDLLEAVIDVYRELAPPPKRLKHVALDLGEEDLARRIRTAWGQHEHPLAEPPREPARADWLTVPVFAGELSTDRARTVAAVAARFTDGTLGLTADQDLALPCRSSEERDRLAVGLIGAGVSLEPDGPAILRVCPGAHQCGKGMAPTRDMARTLADRLGHDPRGWAISGCSNACAQPHLADVGIVCTGVRKDAEGVRRPRYDLLHRTGDGLGEPVATNLTLDALLAALSSPD